MSMKTACLSVAVLAQAAFAAHAQTTLSAYGLLDAGLVAERGCVNCDAPKAVTKVSGGVASASRLGLQGRETLGAPEEHLAAVFTLEAGLLNDTGASDQQGRLFGRQAYVGLDSRLGALTLGRQDNPHYLTLTDVGDPFKGGMAGSAANLVGYAARRYDNTVKYATPKLNGLSASAIYSFGEAPYSSANNRAYGATLGYADGPVMLSVAHQRRNSVIEASGTMPAVDNSSRNSLIAANFNTGFATAYAAYGHNKGEAGTPWDASNPYGALALSTPSTDSRDVLLGLSVPLGRTCIMASYIHKDDRDAADRDANQIAIGITYALSRRTGFYASFAKIKNRNGAFYTVGNASDAGRGDRAFNLGLRHGF